MTEEMIPIFRVANAKESAKWYARLGFELKSEHQFAPGMPIYAFLQRGNVRLHLSEHTGDATPDTLVYFYVKSDIDEMAAEFKVAVKDQPWAREVWLSDPDGNRLRIANFTSNES